MKLKENPYCDGCKLITNCPLQKEKDNLIEGLEIKSCSRWISKVSKPIRHFYPKELQLYNYKRRKLAVHFGKNGQAECGMNQTRMAMDFQVSENINKVTCLNCKRTYLWKEKNRNEQR